MAEALRAVELPSSAAAYSAFVCLMAEEDLLADEEGDPEAVETEEEKVCCRDCLRLEVVLRDAGVISKYFWKFRQALRFGKNSRRGK